MLRSRLWKLRGSENASQRGCPRLNEPEVSVWKIGDLTLDLAQGRLMRGTADVAIRPKTYTMLCHFARNAGRVLSRDELITAIWPDVIVTDDSLTQCVHELRHVLGPKAARLLQTVPRRGYLLAQPEEYGPASRVGASLKTDPLGGFLADRGPAQTKVAGQGRIAIMPFGSPSVLAPRHQLLLDGFVNDVISRIAQLRSFKVIARATTFALGYIRTDPKTVGRTLGVDYMVSGSAELRADRVHLCVDLVSTLDSSILWTQTFSLREADLLAMIDSLTDQIVHKVAAEVTALELDRTLLVPEQSLDAWQSYHRGLGHAFQFDPLHAQKALQFFEKATALDPTFARAHAGSSFCHFYRAFSNTSSDREADVLAAMRSAERAMVADDRNPTAQWAYGRALWLAGDPDAGLKHSRMAAQLSPSFAHANYMIGFIEAHYGDPQKSLEQMDRTEILSPFDPFLASIQITRAMALLRLGQLEEAVIWARRSSRHRNVYSQILGPAAFILAAAGHRDEAQKIVAGILKVNPCYGLKTLMASLYSLTEEVVSVLQRGASEVGL